MGGLFQGVLETGLLAFQIHMRRANCYTLSIHQKESVGNHSTLSR